MFEIRKYILAKQIQTLPVSNNSFTQRSVTAASDARIRYIAGYCVCKLKQKYSKTKSSHMYKLDKHSMNIYKESQHILNLLENMKVEEEYALLNTVNLNSMQDICRRQYTNHSLIVVSDEVHVFFKNLTEKCLSFLVEKTLNKIGSSLFEYVRTELINDINLLQQFKQAACVEESENINHELYITVYNGIIKLFLMVMINQFRKDVKENLNVKKKMAHRKEVRVNVKRKDKNNNDQAATKEPEPEASTSYEPEMKRHCEQVVNDDLCQVCLQEDEKSGNTDWIQCDKCQNWLHRKCAGLGHHMKWHKMTKKNAKFLCKLCL